MDVIPVIDLKNGQVVHAQGGRRDTYRPIVTPLSATSAPADVARGLLHLFAFRQLYIADLDAIEGHTPNTTAIEAIATAAPGVELWVDNGIGGKDAARSWLAGCAHSLVIGSESQADLATIRGLRGDNRVLLSLDFRGDAFQGPPDLRTDTSAWPTRLIVMTLARVGAAAGPDTERVTAAVSQHPQGRVYAAGGVRDASDLGRLSSCGAAGVLVATALHTSGLTRADLVRIARP